MWYLFIEWIKSYITPGELIAKAFFTCLIFLFYWMLAEDKGEKDDIKRSRDF